MPKSANASATIPDTGIVAPYHLLRAEYYQLSFFLLALLFALLLLLALAFGLLLLCALALAGLLLLAPWAPLLLWLLAALLLLALLFISLSGIILPLCTVWRHFSAAGKVRPLSCSELSGRFANRARQSLNLLLPQDQLEQRLGSVLRPFALPTLDPQPRAHLPDLHPVVEGALEIVPRQRLVQVAHLVGAERI